MKRAATPSRALAAAALSLAATFALAGCHGPRTEMVVAIANSGLAIPGDVDSITITVRDVTSGQIEFGPIVKPLCGDAASCLALPTTMTLYPGPSFPHDLVEIEVQALASGAPVIDDATTFMFADGMSQQLEFVLFKSCLHTSCASNATRRACIGAQTCGDLAAAPLGGDLAAPPDNFDFAVGDSSIDFSPPADLSSGDLAGADLSMGDLSTAGDFSSAGDFATASDFSTPHDFSSASDFSPASDFSSSPDLTPSDMPPLGIVFDSASTPIEVSSQKQLSWQHTTGTGTNGILLVGVVENGSSQVSAVTYGSGALPLNRLTLDSINGGGQQVSMWYLLSPPLGVNTITVATVAPEAIAAGSVTYFNVQQSAPSAMGNQSNVGSSSASGSIASAPGDVVVGVFGGDGTTPPLTPGGGQTALVPPTASGTSFADAAIAMSSKPGASPTTSLSWTLNVTRPWGVVLVNLQP